jgi:transposase
MHRIEFSESDLAIIRHERYHHPDPRVARRMEILILKADEQSHDSIARIADVSRSTVHRVLNIYREKGLDGVREFHEQGPTSPLTHHKESLSEEFRNRPPHSVADAINRIEQATGIRRKPTQVRAFLRNTLGMKWRKVAAVPLPPNKTLEQHAKTQDDFLKSRAIAAYC